MSVIQQPYYNKHQILTGQYAQLGRFILKNGNDYVGGFHVLPNGQYFSEFSPSDKSEELFIKQFDVTEDVKVFNRVSGITNVKYINPIPYLIRPTLDDYEEGFLYRYFVQKRNNPLVTIIEIDPDQFNKINIKNQPGINGGLWNKCLIKWKINGSYIQEFNTRELDRVTASGFVGIRGYLINLFEFAK